MLEHRRIQGSSRAKSKLASGGGRTGGSSTKADPFGSGLPTALYGLSNAILIRHLADAAALAAAEGDSRIAEHLVDVAYQLASDE
jgi:hypothetical protein